MVHVLQIRGRRTLVTTKRQTRREAGTQSQESPTAGARVDRPAAEARARSSSLRPTPSGVGVQSPDLLVEIGRATDGRGKARPIAGDVHTQVGDNTCAAVS